MYIRFNGNSEAWELADKTLVRAYLDSGFQVRLYVYVHTHAHTHAHTHTHTHTHTRIYDSLSSLLALSPRFFSARFCDAFSSNLARLSLAFTHTHSHTHTHALSHTHSCS